MKQNMSRAACAWSLLFAAFHFYWALGGSFGLGDGPAADKMSESPGFLAYDLIVGAPCVLGAILALALGGTRLQRIPRWSLLLGSSTATVLLLLRGAPSLLEGVLVATNILPNGFLGMSNEQVYGEADPSAYTIWSIRAVDVYFTLGSVLFAAALFRYHRHHGQRSAQHR
jgi:hypothetical protein